MGASIYWQPLSGLPVVVGAKSYFVEALRRAGLLDVPVGAKDVATLRGMAAAADDADARSAFDALADAASMRPIRIWAEY